MERLQKVAGAYQRALAGRALLSWHSTLSELQRYEMHLRQKRCDELERQLKDQAQNAFPTTVAQLLLQKLNKRKDIEGRQVQTIPAERILFNSEAPDSLGGREQRIQTNRAELAAVNTQIGLLRRFYTPTKVSHSLVLSSLPGV